MPLRPQTPAADGPAPAQPVAMTPQARANEVARLMYAQDTAAQAAGIRVVEVGPGTATTEMDVPAEFTNGHGICHGGYIFLLADSAFAYSCNSHNLRAVAAGAQIEFVAAGHRGDRLTARAQEQHRAGRGGVYDVRVTNQHGALIALFRGKSALIKGVFFDEEESR